MYPKKKIIKKDNIPMFKDGKIDISIKQGNIDIRSNISNIFNKLRFIRQSTIIKTVEFVLSIIVIFFLISHFNYLFMENRSLWNDTLNDIKIHALTESELRAKINQIYSAYLDKKNTFIINENIYAINGKDLGVKFNIDETIKTILRSNESTYKDKVVSRLQSITKQRKFTPIVFIDTQILKSTMERLIPELQNTAQDPQIVLKDNIFQIIPSYGGMTTDYKIIIDQLYRNAWNLNVTTVNIAINNYKPDFTDEYVKQILDKAKTKYIKSYYLSSNLIDNIFTLNIKDHYNLLRFTKIINPSTGNKELVSDLNVLKLKQYLQNISKEIDVVRQDTTLSLNDNLDLTAEGINEDGLTLDIINTSESIYSKIVLADNYSPNINLIIQVDKAKIVQPDEIDTPIKEVIAFGESDFTGSPNNRKHNIEVASKKFQNIIMQPDEEISFNKLLGVVDGNAGYKKELVIKEGGKLTIPEYGGGICQVSTTLYRSALYAGLDITQRRNHSYAIDYYNPDGIDATIYPPNVDLKFKNNFSFPILIQNKLNLDKGKLVFYVYGTNVGRRIELDGPYRYAYKEKPKPVIEYIADKPIGWSENKKGHIGFNTYWTRKIFMENGEEREEKIYSYYKAIPDKTQLGGEAPKTVKVRNLDHPLENSI